MLYNVYMVQICDSMLNLILQIIKYFQNKFQILRDVV